MEYFLVFTGRKWKNVAGEQGITWDICGVFQAEDANTACLVAAQRTGMGTCFAILGTAWGVDTVDQAAVKELGKQVDPMDRLERMGRMLEQSFTALSAGTQNQLPKGDAQ